MLFFAFLCNYDKVYRKPKVPRQNSHIDGQHNSLLERKDTSQEDHKLEGRLMHMHSGHAPNFINKYSGGSIDQYDSEK